jgi:hypothetical protein
MAFEGLDASIIPVDRLTLRYGWTGRETRVFAAWKPGRPSL